MEIKIFHNDSNTPLRELADLLNRAFVERQKEGIGFSYVSYTAEDLMKHVKDGYYIVGYIDDKVVGMVALLQKERFGVKYTTHECLAVDPELKNKGIATKLFLSFLEIAKELHSDFIVSTTAEKASSSIRYHKKNGFKTFLFVSFPSTPYYSYCFIYPINRFKFLNYSVFNKTILAASFLFTKLFKREKNG